MFDFHILNDEGKKAVTEFKSTISEATKKCLEMLPDGRDKAIFITKLEEAVFFGTRAVASKEGNYESKQTF